MPEEGISYMPRHHLMTYEELLELSKLMVSLGIDKIRITGGEPFVRKDLMKFLNSLASIEGLSKIAITSNGLLLKQHLNELKSLGIRDINLSLDSLDRDRFRDLTRRDEFNKVWDCLQALIADGFRVKINCVVIKDRNIEDILPFVECCREWPIEVRFIEEMPFNGTGSNYPKLEWDYRKIMGFIKEQYPNLRAENDIPGETATIYRIPDFQGRIGVIPAFTRTFCGTCNRIRLAANGELRNCLYGPPKLNVKDLLRGGATQQEVAEALTRTISNRAKDGFEAQEEEVKTSMSIIGG
jgi:cyclic pyranopterin phosphate synthase